MSGDPYRPTGPGEPFRPSSAAWNRMLAVAKNAGPKSQGSGRTSDGLRANEIWIRQDAVSTAPRGLPLEVSSPLFDPATSLDAWRTRLIYSGIVPTNGALEGRQGVAVIVSPSASGDICRAVVAGPVQLDVKVAAESHRRVDIVPSGSTPFTYMQTVESGGCGSLVWVQDSGDRTGDVGKALVVLDGPAGGGSALRFARVSSSVSAGTNKWTYTGVPVEQTVAGYGGWTDVVGGASFDFRNLIEDGNTGTGVEGHGVDVGGASYPADFDPQPIPDGTIVQVFLSTLGEYWAQYENADDGECDAGAAAADGKSVLSGTGAPAPGTGVDGEHYIDLATGDLYGPKASGVWPGSPLALVGADGADGADGAAGATGATGPAGADGGAGVKGDAGDAGPAGADGDDGDSAYDVAVSNGFVGSEPAWLASLTGAAGATGPKGDTGDTGAAGATGPAGPAGADGADGADGSVSAFSATLTSSITITGTAADVITWDTPDVIDTGDFSFNATTGVLTVLNAGVYQFMAGVSFKGTSGTSRSNVDAWLAKNGSAEVKGTRKHFYVRQSAYGASAVVGKTLSLAANDTIRLRCNRVAGTTTTQIRAAGTVFEAIRLS